MRAPARRAIAVIDGLSDAALALAAMLLVAILVLVLAEIGSRSLLGRGLVGTWDFSAYALAASVLLAAPYTLRTSGHIRVNLALAALGPGGARALELACTVFGLLATLYIGAALVDQAATSFAYDSRSATTLRFPLGWPQAALALGAGLLALQFVARILRLLVGDPPDDAPAEAGLTSE